MERIVILGCSGHAKVITDIIESMMKSGKDCVIEGYIDDHYDGDEFLGRPVLGKTSDLAGFDHDDVSLVIAIGSNDVRKRIYEAYGSFSYPMLIHPTAYVADTAQINEGTVVMANAVINPFAVVGKQCIINTGAIIEHDSQLEDYVHVSPNASLAGAVKVGEGTHIGIGSSVIQNRVIGHWSVVGAGAVVINNIPDKVTAVGVPASIIRGDI